MDLHEVCPNTDDNASYSSSNKWAPILCKTFIVCNSSHVISYLDKVNFESFTMHMEQNPTHEYMTVHLSLSEMNCGSVMFWWVQQTRCEKTEVAFIS
jgi:hypothetical protein